MTAARHLPIVQGRVVRVAGGGVFRASAGHPIRLLELCAAQAGQGSVLDLAHPFPGDAQR
jgi:hypothetical protein